MVLNQSKAIKKYLAQYAETEATQVFQFAALLIDRNVRFENAICLPCFAEPKAHLHQLLSFLKEQENCLSIIVLNQPDDLTHSQQIESQAKNTLWLSALEKYSQSGARTILYESDMFKFFCIDNNYALLVDRFSKHLIPRDKGVGLARKIGSDIALALYEMGLLRNRWLHSSDADCVLPSNYFASSANYSGGDEVAALVYSFQHIDCSGNPASIHHSDDVVKATALYEKKLRQYVGGLSFAGSAYNHHSIGSCICISLPHYAMCRGFPTISAGEDFYLLNKLRKLGLIEAPQSEPIKIRARRSNRTPFGTGAAIKDILENEDILRARIFYPQLLFLALRHFLKWMKILVEDRSSAEKTIWQQSLIEYWNQTEQNAKKTDEIIPPPAEAILRATRSIHFERALSHCLKQTNNKEAFSSQLFLWFDGFRTLRWLHSLRDESGMTMVAIETDQTSEK